MKVSRDRGGEIERNMLLGKRPRASMRRTTSMTEFNGDFVIPDVEANHTDADQATLLVDLHHQPNPPNGPLQICAANWLAARCHGRLAASPFGGGHQRNSGEFSVVETAPFLRTCRLCNRRLGHGRDIFMYRGDAFCSLECRQQHMKQDERKEKCSPTFIKDTVPAPSGSEQPGDGVAAA